MVKVKGRTRPSAGRSRFRIPWFRLLLIVALCLAAWLIVLDASIRDRFEGRRWQVPAQVFAQPQEIHPGLPLTAAELTTHLDDLGYRRESEARAPGTYSVSAGAIEVFVRSFRFPEEYQEAARFRIRFSGGRVLGLQQAGRGVDWLRLDPKRIGTILPQSGEDRILVRLSEVPEFLVRALLAIEDQNFHEHHGVSPWAILRAAFANLKAGGVVQGGSTLTQQLVKNYFLDSQQTLLRKLNEAAMAVLLELHYDKDEILEAYLNEVFLGQSGKRAIHGFGQGSFFYFGKPLTDLEPHEMALLVGLVKGASYYDPRRHPERARARRDLVLSVAAREGALEEGVSRRAQQRDLGVVESRNLSENLYPAFMALVRRQLMQDYRTEDLDSEGLRVFTTLDPRIQQLAETSVKKTTARLAATGKVNQGLQAAMIVTSHANGEVLALVSDRNPRFAGFNRALDARRSIGSLIKPIVAAAALASGRYTLSSLLDDTSFKLVFENGSEWQPENYDKTPHGAVTLQTALAHSYNLAFARLGLDIGIPEVLAQLEDLGVREGVNPYPATLLGALDLTPYEVSQLYLNLVSGGFSVPQRSIRAVTTGEGVALSRYPLQTQQVFSPQVAYLLQYGLMSVMREGTGKSIYQQWPRSVQFGGKTGTTNDNRDSWFVGFDGRHLVTTWLGRDDNGSTSLSGSTGALKVWTAFMQSVGVESWQAAQPDGIEWHWIDAATGKGASEECSGAVQMPFVAGSAPRERLDCGGSGIRLDGLRRWWENWFE